MAVVKNDAAKRQIMRRLNAQGYKAYSRLLDLFDIYLTDTPGVIGYMVPGKASIVLNKELSIDQVSTIVRHEILHEYLNHAKREADFSEKHKDLGRDHETANIAMDFEISNKGYTDADKVTARSIVLGNEKLRGLVTEDQYKGWENKSFEEMYEELLKQRKQDLEQLKKLLDQMQKLSKKDLEDLEKAIEEAEQLGQGKGDGEGQQSNDDQGLSKPNGSGAKPDSDDAKKDQKDGNGSSSDKTDDQQAKDKNSSSGGNDKLDKLADALKDIKKDLDKVENGKKDEPFDTPKEQNIKKDLARRVAEIKEIFNDEAAKQAIFDDNITAKRREKQRVADDELLRKGADPLAKFKLNLNRFIADQLSEDEDETYSRINPSYEDTEFLMPGKIVRENKFIPKINVYHDVSGSFDDPAKTEMAMRAVDTLNKYVQDGDLIVNRYYFANRVGTSRHANLGGGTSGQPILDHIEETKPTNVIVLTDSDISDCTSNVKVPGAVWMLFYGSRSQNLMDHLHGKRQTKYYDITWR